jgi:putative oxidoreductase
MARLPPIEGGEPKLIIPALEGWYRLVEPLSWLIIRCACGLIMAVHGWPKVLRVIDMIGGAPPGRGSTTRLVILAFFEFFGGLGVALGLFTRFFAPALAIELLVITIGYWPVFAWRQDGYEYTLMWGRLMFAIALRGGGPYSLDRKLGFTL